MHAKGSSKPEPKKKAKQSKMQVKLSAQQKTTSKPLLSTTPKRTHHHSKQLLPKPTPKAPSPSPEPLLDESEDDAEDDGNIQNDGSEHDDENEQHLHGFSTDEDDSSDEDDDDDDDPPAIDLTKLPTISKDDAVIRQKLEKAKRQPAKHCGVLYLSHIPHGFYEDQLKAYFSQFGDVTRLRLSRNKKTGRSKHYAFIEFDSSSVAQIVAETMDNYLLMGHILKCRVIPREEIHPELWIGANRKWRVVPHDRIARVKHNKPRTELQRGKLEKRLIKRQNDRKRKLADAGIQYDFEAVAYKKIQAC